MLFTGANNDFTVCCSGSPFRGAAVHAAGVPNASNSALQQDDLHSGDFVKNSQNQL